MRRYMLKTVTKDNNFSPTEIDSETEVDMSVDELQIMNTSRRIRVVDRFGIILQIFALRAKTRVA